MVVLQINLGTLAWSCYCKYYL